MEAAMMTGLRILWVALLVAALVALMTLVAQDRALAQDGSGKREWQEDCGVVCAAYGCPPSPPCLGPEFVHGAFLPTVGMYAGLEMPEMRQGEETFRLSDVDRMIQMPGAVGLAWEWFRATTLVTVVDATQTPAALWACWYGSWGGGANTGKCDRLVVGW
jgi:hypothetical protein